MSQSSFSIADSSNSLQALASSVGETWDAIFTARSQGLEHLAKLQQKCANLKPPSNTSVISFGSLAREEWTSGSDVDWTLMIDGPSDMDHFEHAKDVESLLIELGYREPGSTKIFGEMASSYELVHYIGGLEDTNQNITRRILMLLESVPLSNPLIHERVLRAILKRYVIGDPSSTHRDKFRVPLFLLNDVVRYWRTIAVDYAAKKWQRSNKGWGLRNIKLRMSRKLLFAKGMLTCFLCDGSFSGQPKGPSQEIIQAELLNICFNLGRCSAIDLLATALLEYAKPETGRRIFNAYNRFVAMLNNVEQRKRLDEIEFDEANDSLFGEQRENSREFQKGLEEFFFDSEPTLTKYTKRYGVF